VETGVFRGMAMLFSLLSLVHAAKLVPSPEPNLERLEFTVVQKLNPFPNISAMESRQQIEVNCEVGVCPGVVRNQCVRGTPDVVPKDVTGLKIGLTADQGMSENARGVLQMLNSNNVDLILHAGDITYDNSQSVYQASNGGSGCPAGREAVTVQECEAFFDGLGLDRSQRNVGFSTTRPSGCSYNTVANGQPTFNFNTASVGQGQSNLAPICAVRHPELWLKQIDATVPGIPYITALGNHDTGEQPPGMSLQQSYDGVFEQIQKIGTCEGETGIMMTCTFRGLTIVVIAPGIKGGDYDQYITAGFAKYPSKWRICLWHKNMRDMQAGRKSNEAGWVSYEACRRHGAFVVNGHEHMYSRSYEMTSFIDQFFRMTGGNQFSPITLREENVAQGVLGSTLAVVVGTGGYGVNSLDATLKNNA
jgi:hypothetical protein